MKDVLTIIMAGGEGKRLMPLTRDHSKPAPFGGIYRLIDIPLIQGWVSDSVTQRGLSVGYGAKRRA